MERFKVTTQELFCSEPESLNVGQLNKAVRLLRDEVYQLRIRLQKYEVLDEVYARVDNA